MIAATISKHVTMTNSSVAQIMSVVLFGSAAITYKTVSFNSLIAVQAGFHNYKYIPILDVNLIMLLFEWLFF